MSARFETKGANHWLQRQGYQYTQRVPAPILPQERPSRFARWFGR